MCQCNNTLEYYWKLFVLSTADNREIKLNCMHCAVMLNISMIIDQASAVVHMGVSLLVPSKQSSSPITEWDGSSRNTRVMEMY